MKQVVMIHGSGSFASLNRKNFLEELKNKEVDIERFERALPDWKTKLGSELGSSYQVLFPKMPDADNPDYNLWKVWFEKILASLGDEVIVVGHSLGGIFAIKYFTETQPAPSVRGLLAVAAPYFDMSRSFYTSFELDVEKLSKVPETYKTLLYFSKDDFIVPYEDAEKYKMAMPNATYRVVDGYGHFIKIENFPEIIEDIKSL